MLLALTRHTTGCIGVSFVDILALGYTEDPIDTLTLNTSPPSPKNLALPFSLSIYIAI